MTIIDSVVCLINIIIHLKVFILVLVMIAIYIIAKVYVGIVNHCDEKEMTIFNQQLN